MPTNPNAPFGFRYIGQINGSPPNFGLRRGLLARANATKIFTGDVLLANSSGYLAVATSAASAVGGVAHWFEWVSLSQNKTVRSNYWPGTGAAEAASDIAVYYHADPFALFEVQCLLGPVVEASIGLCANINVGGGGQTIGAGNLSSFTLDDGNMDGTTTRPFKLYSLPIDSAGPQPAMLMTPGYDTTQAYNRVRVTLNNLVA